MLPLANNDVFLVTKVAQRDRVETLHPIAKAVDYRHVTDPWIGGQGVINLARSVWIAGPSPTDTPEWRGGQVGITGLAWRPLLTVGGGSQLAAKAVFAVGALVAIVLLAGILGGDASVHTFGNDLYSFVHWLGHWIGKIGHWIGETWQSYFGHTKKSTTA
jgi:hypothetical protein